jgi:hypothetical protein
MAGPPMSEPQTPPDAIIPASGGAQLAEVAAEKALERLLPDASAQQRKAVVTLIAPWAETLVRALDDLVRIPGTSRRIGLDAVVGFFFPAVGDAVTGVGSMALLFLAVRHKVPTVAIARMLFNIAMDTLVGSVPIVGDVFDVFWKSNRKNLEIIRKYKDNPKEKPHPSDYVLVALGVALAIANVVVPTVLLVLFGASIFTLVGSLLTMLFGSGSGAH